MNFFSSTSRIASLAANFNSVTLVVVCFLPLHQLGRRLTGFQENGKVLVQRQFAVSTVHNRFHCQRSVPTRSLVDDPEVSPGVDVVAHSLAQLNHLVLRGWFRFLVTLRVPKSESLFHHFAVVFGLPGSRSVVMETVAIMFIFTSWTVLDRVTERIAGNAETGAFEKRKEYFVKFTTLNK